jgi:peptide chain release factor 3
MRVFAPGGDRAGAEEEMIEGLDNPLTQERFGDAFTHARGEIELLRGATHEFDREKFLAGNQTPVFFGSAINNFGVREVLDALVQLAPSPRPKPALTRTVEPTEPGFTGVVFKIQANMDPAHRDRVAFVRVCSGRFERGMRLKLSRTGKDVKTANAVSFLSQRRDIVEDAWPGDIVGLPNRGLLHLGDTLTEGEEGLQFIGLPFFAPEIFHTVEVADPIRTKQLRKGLQQLGEEGAIQVFRHLRGGPLLLGAVGPLQLEVVAHRLEHEYSARARMTPSPYRLARWIAADDPAELERFIEANEHRVAHDVVNAPAVLYAHQSELRAATETWPKIRFHALREHGGLAFQPHLDMA